MMHCALMLLFSALLYWRGEQVAMGIRHLPVVSRLNAAMRRFCWLPSDPRRGAWRGGYRAGTGGTWRRRAGDFRRALRYPVDGSDDPFVSGSVGAVAGIDSSHYLALLDRRHHGAPCCWFGAPSSALWIT